MCKMTQWKLPAVIIEYARLNPKGLTPVRGLLHDDPITEDTSGQCG